ncbi:MAG TPA: DUF929 family protein [Candidatus Dormibacteraeota bacterium]|nr:DUF929 family protein [Candidatus Dormibacteraeota bacterium]
MSKKSTAERRQAASRPAAGGGGGNGRGPRAGSGGGGPARHSSRRSPRGGQRRPWGIFASIGGVIAVFVAVIIFFDLTSGAAVQDTQVLPAPASVVAAITHVPQSTLDTVGGGAANYPPRALTTATKLTANGKPELLYIGAEYCPYCALERWSLIGALSKFGSFSNLKIIKSSLTDGAGPNIATFTFAHGVSYTSRYITFVAREIYSNVPDPSTATGYANFQSLNSQQSQLFTTLGQSGFPFVDFGGIAAQVGTESSSPGPTGLSNYSWQQVASFLSKPHSSQAQMILGGVNYDTAAICKMTGNKPGKVCGQTVIQQLEGGL